MFSWDAAKAITNFEKHGISFEEAATVFSDPEGLDWEDLEHSTRESRYKTWAVNCPKNFNCGLHNKEIKRWQGDNQDHQREAREPQRTPGLFRTVRLIFLIFQIPRTRSFDEPGEWGDQKQDGQRAS